MRKQIIYMVLLIGATGAHIFADNPIITHRYLADPNGFVYNNRLYAICSNDDDNTNGYTMKGSVLISTRDMINWTDHGVVYYAPKDARWSTTAYAPSAVVRNGKVYYYIPNSGSAIGVFVADRPEGPLKDTLGKALITGNHCDGVAWCFDPGVFVDDDEQAYLVYGGGSNNTSPFGQNIRMVKLNNDMISLSGSPIRLQLQNSFEGPFIHKYQGRYYLQYPMSPNSNIGLSMSSNPTSGWAYKGSILDNPTLNGRNINGGNNSHTSTIEYNGHWYMLYHDRRLSNGATYKRNVSIEKMSYNSDGSIQKVVVTTGITQAINFNPFDSIPAVTYSRQNQISAYTNVNNSGIARTNLLVPRRSGAWIRISGVDFGTGAKSFRIHGGGTASAAEVEIRTGSENGPLAGTCTINRTGSWTSLTTASCDVSGLTGVKDLYLRFTGTDSNTVFTWFRFTPSGSNVLNLSNLSTEALKSNCQIFDLRGRTVTCYPVPGGLGLEKGTIQKTRSLSKGMYLVLSQEKNGGRLQRIVLLQGN
ncbi:MAG TPA: glycoside hydrolase family 43 protein [Chitinispirillaceae bacterium]|nr:glycoside hydrolase family 43 protein [Chitinispirillaceae bacterium]